MTKIAETNGKLAEIEMNKEVASPAAKMSTRMSEPEKPPREWNFYTIITHPKLCMRVITFSAINAIKEGIINYI